MLLLFVENLKACCVCVSDPLLRMHVSIRFWQAFLVLFPVSFPFYGTRNPGCTTDICSAVPFALVGEMHEIEMPMVHVQLPARPAGDRPGRGRCTVHTHRQNNRRIGQGCMYYSLLIPLVWLGCAFLRVQDACVNCCPLFYDRSFPVWVSE